MTIDGAYVEVDRLNRMWNRVEEVLGGYVVAPPGLRLTIKRAANKKVRLHFDNRPVAECSMVEKIEAVEHFPALLDAIAETTDEQARAAKAAADKLEAWLNS